MTEKHFFQLSDDGIYYLVVAASLESAQQLMSTTSCEFGLACTWTELSAEQTALKQRCHAEDERGVIKLSDARIGDWFSSEW